MLNVYSALILLLATSVVRGDETRPAFQVQLYANLGCIGNQFTDPINVVESECINTPSAGWNAFHSVGKLEGFPPTDTLNGCIWGYTTENCADKDHPASIGVKLNSTDCGAFPDHMYQYKSYWASFRPCTDYD